MKASRAGKPRLVWHERAGLSANRNSKDAGRRRANKDITAVERKGEEA